MQQKRKQQQVKARMNRLMAENRRRKSRIRPVLSPVEEQDEDDEDDGEERNEQAEVQRDREGLNETSMEKGMGGSSSSSTTFRRPASGEEHMTSSSSRGSASSRRQSGTLREGAVLLVGGNEGSMHLMDPPPRRLQHITPPSPLHLVDPSADDAAAQGGGSARVKGWSLAGWVYLVPQ